MEGCCSQGSWGVWGSLEQASGGNLPQEPAWEAGGKEKTHTGYGITETEGAMQWTYTTLIPGAWGHAPREESLLQGNASLSQISVLLRRQPWEGPPHPSSGSHH